MRVDITSMFFNSKIEGKTATPAWSTSIGENDIRSYKLGVSQLIDSLTLNVCIDKEHLDLSGGSDSCDLLYFCVFDKVSVNGILLPNISYIIYLVREHSNSHEGRIRLCYPPYAKYTKKDGTIIWNEYSNKEIAKSIGCTLDGCWFVYDISVIDQHTLNFETKVVNSSTPVIYKGESKDRSAIWNGMLLENNDIPTEKELGEILGQMYINADKGNQKVSLFVFGVKYGKYLSGYSLKNIIQYAKLTNSYETELSTAYKLYQAISKNKYNISSSAIIEKLLSENLNEPLQQIYYGAPGTGKSHGIKDKENLFTKVIRTTFHPDSDYSTFVGAYKPTMEESEVKVTPIVINNGISLDQNNGTYKEKRITYTFVKQAFLKAYIEAWNRHEKGEKVLLVIEEINRGNCAQIFGDLFQLLDRNEQGYSEYAIQADEDLRQVLSEEFANINGIPANVKSGEELLLPPNLYIWATMNTSDQSLFPIDSAFKRRWDWKYVPIDTAKENWNIKVNNNNYSWTNFLDVINEKIFAKTDSEDKQLGFYFCKAEGNVISAEKFVGKVLFYIYNDVYKDYGFDEDFFIDKTDNKKLTFRSFYNFDGSINEGKVEAILKNLEIKKTDDDSDGNDKVGMSVQYNGQTVHEKNDLETYVKILELIGVDRIATLDIKCYDQNIVGVEPPGNYAWRTVNNYKVLTFKLHRHMERILNEIAAKLQIDLHVSFE